MSSFYFSRHRKNQSARRAQGPCRTSLVEVLEARQLLSGMTYLVSNINDSGAGSLRQALLSSNAATGSADNTIDFKIGTTGAYTIVLKSALPAVTQPVVIDGTSEPGTGTAPRIELKGTNPGPLTAGLALSASNSTVKGLSIVGFTSDGVQINSGSKDVITDDYIGITPGGAALGNDGNGVIIQGSSSGNTIGGTAAGSGDVISGNFGNGVEVTDSSSSNVVETDLIGTNVAGTAAIKNALSGVLITGTLADTFTGTASNSNPSDNNTVGPGDLISGNTQYGVQINDGSTGNKVTSSRIGTDITGSFAVHNAYDGVFLSGVSTDHNTVGPGDVISGNWQRGVEIGNSASDNLVVGDLIGVNSVNSGTTYDLGNEYSGVVIDSTSSGNTIGGTTAGSGNVISGNWGDGVAVYGQSGNLFEGNWIGTNAYNARVGNGVSGIAVTGTTATGTTIGGTVKGAGNVISGNAEYGVLIVGGSSGTVLQGNLIGTGVGGNGALPNGWDGVGIANSTNNIIGGTATGAGNTISGNGLWGVLLNTGTQGTVLQGNLIGTNVGGTAAVPNAWDGVAVEGTTTTNNTIGGTAAGAGNTISGNTRNGIYLTSYAHGNLVQGNWIGTNSKGAAIANVLNGVQIDVFAAYNTIGGTTAAAANTISYNDQSGVYLLGDGVKNPNGVGDNPGNVIEYDVIDHNLLDGVRINAAPEDGIMVLYCTIELNAKYGIWENNSLTYSFTGSIVINNNGKATNPQIYTNN